MSRLTIRYADTDDSSALSGLSKETFWDAYKTESRLENQHITEYMETAFSVEQIRSELDHDNTLFLLADDKTVRAGYAKLEFGSRRPEISALRPVELCRIYLMKSSYGKGFGGELLQRCFREATSREHDGIWLSVWEHNKNAVGFYKKHGFEIVGTHGFQLGSSIQQDYIMEKIL